MLNPVSEFSTVIQCTLHTIAVDNYETVFKLKSPMVLPPTPYPIRVQNKS